MIGGCRPTPTEPAPTAGVPLPPAGGGGSPSTLQTVTWRFDADGACLETFLTITDGIQNQMDRLCTWTADVTRVTVTYAGVGGPVTFSLQYSFPAPDVLRLDSDEFSRVA